MESIYSEYSKILNNYDDWFRFTDINSMREFNINNLFDTQNANNFIRQMFFNENLVSLIHKVKFPNNREAHTVSAFFLGILLKEKLKLSVKSIPKVCKDYKKNFIYFWSMICLSHDLTFWLENNEKYINKCKTIKDFCEIFNIEYNLIDSSKFGNLFENYYNYIIEKKGKLDHGVTCGIMLYDQLMKQHAKYTKISTEAVCFLREPWKYNKKFKDYALKISETIARHNLWVSGSHNEDLYREYQLFDLIPSNANFKRVSYSEQDSLLFLLGLVDTLEPIKCCTRKQKSRNVYDILKNVNIQCNNRNKSISIESEKYISKETLDDWKNMEQWLDLTAYISDTQNSITISFEYEKMPNEKTVA